MNKIITIITIIICLISCVDVELDYGYQYFNVNKPKNNNELIINKKGETGSIYKIIKGNGALYQYGYTKSKYFVRATDNNGATLWENEYDSSVRSINYYLHNNTNYLMIALNIIEESSSTKKHYIHFILLNADNGEKYSEKTLNAINNGLSIGLNALKVADNYSSASDKIDFTFVGWYKHIGSNSSSYGLIGNISFNPNNNKINNKTSILKAPSSSYFLDFNYKNKTGDNKNSIIVSGSNGVYFFNELNLYNYVDDITISNAISYSTFSIPSNGNSNIYSRDGSLIVEYDNNTAKRLFVVGETSQEKRGPTNAEELKQWTVGKITSISFQNNIFKQEWDKDYSFSSAADDFSGGLLNTNSNELEVIGGTSSYYMTKTGRNFGNGLLATINKDNGNLIKFKTFGRDKYKSSFNSIVSSSGKMYMVGYTDYYKYNPSDSEFEDEPNWMVDFKDGNFNIWFTAIDQ